MSGFAERLVRRAAGLGLADAPPPRPPREVPRGRAWAGETEQDPDQATPSQSAAPAPAEVQVTERSRPERPAAPESPDALALAVAPEPPVSTAPAEMGIQRLPAAPSDSPALPVAPDAAPPAPDGRREDPAPARVWTTAGRPREEPRRGPDPVARPFVTPERTTPASPARGDEPVGPARPDGRAHAPDEGHAAAGWPRVEESLVTPDEGARDPSRALAEVGVPAPVGPRSVRRLMAPTPRPPGPPAIPHAPARHRRGRAEPEGGVEVHIGSIELEVIPPEGEATPAEPRAPAARSAPGPAGFDDYAVLRGASG